MVEKLLTKECEIKLWLDCMGIVDYTIEPNLVVNVASSVHLTHKKLNFLPIQFGEIKGEFNCSFNELKTLKGSPFFVKNNFTCSNNQLTTLKYSPKIVNAHYDCSRNKIKTLDSFQTVVQGELNCSMNPIQFQRFKVFQFQRFYHRCEKESQKIALFSDMYLRGLSHSKILYISFDEFQQKFIQLEKDFLLSKMPPISEKLNKIKL